ncbi:MAG: hypothetical protein ABSF25_23850 [Bryobacteraceae bacterium]
MLCLPLALRAQLSKEDREAAKKMISGTLYLRVQAPQKYGLGYWAPYSVSMLEAAPTGVSADRKLAEPLKSIPKNGYHLKQEEVYWGYLANTPVRYGKLESEEGKLVVWMERVEPNTDVSIDFIDIKSLDDFTKAFNLALSKVPLQDEHPEWPSAVREGIASGKLVVGMTVEQARIVVGAPLSISAGEDNGSKTEKWILRQDPGKVLGGNKKRGAWMRVSTRTGFPTSITFRDGKLLSMEGEAERNLDPKGSAWLDDHKGAPATDVTGQWYERAWGVVSLRQAELGGTVIGKTSEYEITGVVSGKRAYLILAQEGKTVYSAVVSLEEGNRLEGKYQSGLMREESKGRSISLARR